MEKPLVILRGEIKSPPFSVEARRWAGFLLRKLQKGIYLTMPDSRPMPSIGPRCHELRISDSQSRMIWRIIYRIAANAIVIADVFVKKTQNTPADAIDRCQRRLMQYDIDRKAR